MKNRTTRLLSLLLALAMLTGLLPMQASAEKPKVASSINIEYDAEHAFVSTHFTGREATELLRISITSPKGRNLSDTPGGWYVYESGSYTDVCENREGNFETLSESGGLLSLRRKAEAAGGTMHVESSPAFVLTLYIPSRLPE